MTSQHSHPSHTAQPGANLTGVTLPYYGVNAHYFQGGVYATNLPGQVRDCQNIGVKILRHDCHAGDETAVESTLIPGYAPLLVQPVFDTYGAYTKSEASTYSTYHAYGVAWANAVAGKVPIIEMMNEVENEYFPPGSLQYAGMNVTDLSGMNIKYWNAFRGMVRGFYDGFRSVDTSGQTLIAGPSIGWTHWGITGGLWAGLAPDGTNGHPQCRWDITNHHWYADDGDITYVDFGGGQVYNVLDFLQTAFGLPILLSEIGVQAVESEADYDAYIQSSLAQYAGLASTYNIVGVNWYELYNFEQGQGGEWMGLFSDIAIDNNDRALVMANAIIANPM